MRLLDKISLHHHRVEAQASAKTFKLVSDHVVNEVLDRVKRLGCHFYTPIKRKSGRAKND